MSELSDEASESEQLGVSLSLWLGESPVSAEELDVPLDLHTACSIGQYDVVAECIQRREVDLNRKNAGGWTPLMYASYIGHDNIANLLLEVGVNVNATTAKGQTPLMLAASCGNESIAYFLLHQGAELEVKDRRGWTALFHCTSAGHQQMVKFLLDNNADANVREPGSGFTPLMEAAASGHEIIVQYLLDHKVKADERNAKGETARALAMLYGYTKIASLIDSRCPRNKAGLFQDLSSSEDSDSAPPRPRASRSGRAKGASIHDGPQAIAKFRVGAPSGKCRSSDNDALCPLPSCFPMPEPRAAAAGYATFGGIDERSSDGIRYRDVTSPINELDGQSNSSRGQQTTLRLSSCRNPSTARKKKKKKKATVCADESPFFDHDMPTMRSSSSSSEGLPHLMGWEGSVESNEDSDQGQKSSSRRVTKTHHAKGKSRHAGNDALHGADVAASYNGPKDLAEFLEQLGFSKYLPLLEEQDIDLRIFLTLTENDLKEIGITLFGPKRKMTSAIARWHSSARPPSDALEQSYADQLEAEMQEMAIQLHKVTHDALLPDEARITLKGGGAKKKKKSKSIRRTASMLRHKRSRIFSTWSTHLVLACGPRQRCEEVEALQSQVSQEKELRAVMEGCLMEDKMAWRRVHGQLAENHRLTQDMSATLGQARACRSELLALLNGTKTAGFATNSGASELVKKLDVYEEELADTLQTVLQSLRRLSAPEKVADSWERP